MPKLNEYGIKAEVISQEAVSRTDFDYKQFKRDDVLEAMLSLWAHAHGLICLHRGGRFSLSAKDFKALYRRSLRRLLDGMRI